MFELSRRSESDSSSGLLTPTTRGASTSVRRKSATSGGSSTFCMLPGCRITTSSRCVDQTEPTYGSPSSLRKNWRRLILVRRRDRRLGIKILHGAPRVVVESATSLRSTARAAAGTFCPRCALGAAIRLGSTPQ